MIIVLDMYDRVVPDGYRGPTRRVNVTLTRWQRFKAALGYPAVKPWDTVDARIGVFPEAVPLRVASPRSVDITKTDARWL